VLDAWAIRAPNGHKFGCFEILIEKAQKLQVMLLYRHHNNLKLSYLK